MTDFGDLPEVPYRPDPQHPQAQNVPLVVEVAKGVAKQVNAVVREEALPLVLGGDCTITLGVLAGLIPQLPKLGLMYFDGDLDLNTPATTVSGILDGMGMAHMTGKGVDALARAGPRYPLMAEEDIVLFGCNTGAGWIDAAELQLLPQCRMLTYPATHVQGTVEESAQEALTELESRAGAVLVHLDVDVIDYGDFPAADVPHLQGLTFNDAMAALRVFVGSRKLAGLVITEFNVDRDPDGALARRFVDAVAEVLEGLGK